MDTPRLDPLVKTNDMSFDRYTRDLEFATPNQASLVTVRRHYHDVYKQETNRLLLTSQLRQLQLPKALDATVHAVLGTIQVLLVLYDPERTTCDSANLR